jgi:hypothetical protein
MTTKGKSRYRTGRRDILRTNAANQRRKIRQQSREDAAKQRQQARYNQHAYDGSQEEDE